LPANFLSDLDVYNLHWPARYTPQANWGQSLNYDYESETDPYWYRPTSFAEIAAAMGDLVKEGKIRGWGMCNDNAYGLAASCAASRALGVEPPCMLMNDFSLLNRRIEENGVAEAGSPINENVGFMAYDVLAGGVLTGKYGLPVLPTSSSPSSSSSSSSSSFSAPRRPPASVDNPDQAEGEKTLRAPRGRMDTFGWGRTLYRYRSEPALLAAAEYERLARRYGMNLTELSLRWCRERRAVTTALLGTTSMEQLDQDLAYFATKKDPLPKELLWEIDRVHMKNRLPIFSSTAVGPDWDGEGEIGERIP
jgi:aryl-alcohol dehydrogenase-like predicted oxidoreductase